MERDKLQKDTFKCHRHQPEMARCGEMFLYQGCKKLQRTLLSFPRMLDEAKDNLEKKSLTKKANWELQRDSCLLLGIFELCLETASSHHAGNCQERLRSGYVGKRQLGSFFPYQKYPSLNQLFLSVAENPLWFKMLYFFSPLNRSIKTISILRN